MRLADWIDEAVAAGAKLLCGGVRRGAMFEATLLEDVPTSAKVCTKGAFGPVAVLSKFADFASNLGTTRSQRKPERVAPKAPRVGGLPTRPDQYSRIRSLGSASSAAILLPICWDSHVIMSVGSAIRMGAVRRFPR